MLGEKHWYSEPDDSIAVWFPLVLEVETGTEGQYISAWHIGKANPQRIIHTESMEIDSPLRESELLNHLLSELQPNKCSGGMIITPSAQTIQLLRSRLVLSSVESPTLRGFDHLPVMDLLTEHFSIQVEYPEEFLNPNQRCGNSPPTDAVSLADLDIAPHHTPIEQLWELYKTVGPLVPRESATGSSL